MTSPLRLLAVHAHPDDESSKGAASTRLYVDKGVEVLVVSCTGGERGSVLNLSHPPVAESEMGDVRRREMAKAAEVLGISHQWLGFEDSGLPEGDPLPPLPVGCFAALDLAEVTPALTEVILNFKPHVVTTYDENGGYPHPDHIRTHEITMAAVADAAKASVGAWQVLKIYYHHTFSRKRVETIHSEMISRGLPSPYVDWLDGWDEDNDVFARVTTRIACSDYFEHRDAALRAHATQVDPDGAWFAVPRDIEREVWPTEDFELAWSAFEAEVPESDLFAGIVDYLESDRNA
ncbi:MAG: hypothetical protein RIS75_870 [Actinomycetota bacterium]|jgi:mycothiol S-conjugate amidase